MNFLDGKLDAENGSLWLDLDAFRLQVPPQAKKLDDYIDKNIIVGFRPEDISDKDRAGFASPGNVMTARIDVIEPIGSEELLYVSVGKHTFVAEIQEISGGASEKRALVEKEIELAFNMDKLHLFDPQTENAILNP
jgi:multiple sugar transport system ATP-binding protein